MYIDVDLLPLYLLIAAGLGLLLYLVAQSIRTRRHYRLVRAALLAGHQNVTAKNLAESTHINAGAIQRLLDACEHQPNLAHNEYAQMTNLSSDQVKQICGAEVKLAEMSSQEVCRITGLSARRVESLLRGMERQGDLCSWTYGPRGIERAAISLPTATPKTVCAN